MYVYIIFYTLSYHNGDFNFTTKLTFMAQQHYLGICFWQSHPETRPIKTAQQAIYVSGKAPNHSSSSSLYS